MSFVVLNSGNIDEVLADSKIALIYFRADWCGPCEVFNDIYVSISGNHEDVVFATIDIEDEPDLTDDFDIDSVPTLVIIRDQNLVFSHVGIVSPRDLESLIEQARSMNLSDVG